MMRAGDIASFIRDGHHDIAHPPILLNAIERRNLENLLNQSRAADDDKAVQPKAMPKK
jgi:hypothetical protein